MNLQCPTCLKPLTVPDQYAGQMMKCPLCSSTFSVPAPGGAGDGLPPLPGGPPVPPPNPASPPVTTSPAPSSPAVTPPVSPGLPPLSPSAPVSGTVPTSTPALSSGSSAPTGGYANNCALYFRPEVMRWFAPVCVLLIFVLQFFPWVGIYPGGVEVMSQGAWGTAFGGFSQDDDMIPPKGVPESEQPTASVWMIFYILLFLPTLVLTIASFLLELGVISAGTLPPQVQPLLKWRWAAVAGLNLLVFLFLALQMVLGFSIESKVTAKAAADTKVSEVKGTKERKQAQAMYGAMVATVGKTSYLWLAFWLHLLAVIGAWTTFCIHDRPGKPIPRLELSW